MIAFHTPPQIDAASAMTTGYKKLMTISDHGLDEYVNNPGDLKASDEKQFLVKLKDSLLECSQPKNTLCVHKRLG